jgi:hypothetical protein
VRKLISVVAAAAFVASSTAAFAADTQASGSAQPLAPGQAAGVHNAEMEWTPHTLWIGGGIVVLAVGTALVLSSNNGRGNNTHVATGTTP